MFAAAALILSTLLAGATSAPDAAALRDQATRAFKAKNYTQACPLFAQASALEPKNADLLSDLGLCWDKAGDPTKAQAAELQAAALGDAKVRLHAYYNLWRAGRALDRQSTTRNAKGETVPGCVTWPSDTSCPQTLTSCPYQEETRGTTFGNIYSGIAVCDNKAQALAYNQYGPTPTAGCISLADKVQPETFCRPQDVCVDNADQSKNDTPACQAAISHCIQNPPAPLQADCAVVFVDACQKRLGVVCNHKAMELTPAANFAADDLPAAPEKTKSP